MKRDIPTEIKGFLSRERKMLKIVATPPKRTQEKTLGPV